MRDLPTPTEDRKTYGLVLDQTIRRNVPLANLEAIAAGGVVDRHRESEVAEDYRRRINIRSSSIEQATMNLSGGNQQKVVLSKWLFADPDILILDEPTRGIDVGAKFEIYTIIRDLAASGKSLIVISSELPELLGITDRLYVMNRGRIVGELPTPEATQEKIMSMIIRSDAARERCPMAETTAGAATPAGGSAMGYLRSNMREYGILIALVVIMAFFQFATGGILLRPVNSPT